MAREACARVGIRRRRAGEMDAEQLFAAPVRLTGDVDDGDDRAGTRAAVLDAAVLGDRTAYLPRERPRLIESHLAATRAREAVLRIGDHREVARVLAADGRIRHPHGACDVRQQSLLTPGERLKPAQAT